MVVKEDYKMQHYKYQSFKLEYASCKGQCAL